MNGGAWKISLLAGLVSVSAFAGSRIEPSLKIVAEERYDDDAAALLTAPAAGPTGLLMSKVSPQLGLKVRDPLTTVDSWYAADLLYRHGSGNTTLDHRGRITLKRLLTERLTLDSDLQLWRVTDPTSLPRLGMARAFAPVLYGKAEGALSYRLTERFTLRGGYKFEGAKFYGANPTEGFAHSPYTEGWYRLTRRSDVGVDYRMQYFLFQQQVGVAHGAAAAYRYRLDRRMTLTAKAGPTFFSSTGHQDWRALPRVQIDLWRDGQYFDVGLNAGHDLVGASGFTTAVWADYASFNVEWRYWRAWRFFAGANIYRNGKAPSEGWLGGDEAVSSGYALGGGVEWELHRALSLQFSLERYAQLGALERNDAGAHLERNIASLRLNLRAF